MAGDVKDLKVNLTANDKNVTRVFSTVSESAGKLHERVGILGEGLKKVLEFGGAFAVVEVFKDAMKEAAQYQATLAQTNAVIKSTGDIAGISAKGLQSQAKELSELSGTQDQVILSGENVVATFTNVRNAAGKGNDIFNQATKASLNLSLAMGKSMPDAARLVAKALNDPAKGLGALSRAGVQFTSTQKDMIKHLEATGHGMDAQKIILAKLNTEFGGAAKAAGGTLQGQLNKLKNLFNDTARDLAAKLIPYLTKAAEWLQKEIPKGIAAAKQAFTQLKPFLTTVVNDLKSLGQWVVQNRAWLEKLAVGVGAVVAVVKIWTAAQKLLNAVMKTNPILLVISLVALLVTSFITAWKTSKTFRDTLTKVWYDVEHAVGIVVKKVVDWAAQMVRFWMDYVGMFVKAAAKLLGWVPGIGPKLKQAADTFSSFENATLASMRGFADAAGNLGVDAGEKFRAGVNAGLGGQGNAEPGYGTSGGSIAAQWAPSLAKTNAANSAGAQAEASVAAAHKAAKSASQKLNDAMKNLGSAYTGDPGAAGGGGGSGKKKHSGASSKAASAAHKKVATAAREHALELKKLAAQAKATAEANKKAADQRAKVEKALETATLASVKKQADAYAALANSFRKTTADAIQGGALDLTQLASDANGTVSLGTLQSNLAAKLDAVKKFAADLKALAAAGASQDLIAQVAGMGPDQGDTLATQLVSGGADAIKGVSDQMKQISDAANAGATALTQQFYGPGASSIDQYIAGLSSRFPALKTALAAITTEVNSALGMTATTATSAAGGRLLSAPRGSDATVVHTTINIDGKAVATAISPAIRKAAQQTANRSGTYVGAK